MPAVTGNAVHTGIGILRVPDLTEIGMTTATTQRSMRLLDEFLEAEVNLTILYFRSGFREAHALVAGNASSVCFGKNVLAGLNRLGKPIQARCQSQQAREIDSNPVHENSPHILTMAGQNMTADTFGLLVEFSH